MKVNWKDRWIAFDRGGKEGAKLVVVDKFTK